MPRVKLPSGGWRDLDEATTSVVPFQRANGQRMTDSEIAATTKDSGPVGRYKLSSGGKVAPRRYDDRAPILLSDEELETTWRTFLAAETRQAAADVLGIKLTNLDGRLHIYMRNRGLTGKPTDHRRAHALGPVIVDEPTPVVAPLPADPEPAAEPPDSEPEPPIQIDVQTLATLADLETNIVRIAETAGRLEGITDVLENGWMQELSDVQAALVLSAIVSTIGRTSHDEAKRIMGALDAHGFHLVIRLKS